jgi:Bacterial PH domain
MAYLCLARPSPSYTQCYSIQGTDISQELDTGEKLLWSGRPRQGVLFRSSDIFLIPFSLMWGGFAVFWEAAALFATSRPQSNPPDFVRFAFPLWGLPFVALGLYFMFGRFFVDRAQRAKTTYGITDRRVIIRSGLFSRTTKSLNLRTLSDVTLAEKSDGSGTITLGPTAGLYSGFYGTSWPGMGRQLAPCLDTIPEAKSVYDILRRAQSTA